MRLLDRYLLRELLVPLGYCLAGLLIFYIAFDLIGSLNSYQEHQLLLADILELYVVKIPEILVFILPIVLLLALLYALTNHARHNEVTAIRAAGLSLWRICLPYLGVGFVLSLALFAMNEFWVPNAAERRDEIINRHSRKAGPATGVETDLSFDNPRDGRFWEGVYNLNTHTIFAPIVHWLLPDGSTRKLIAERADYLDGVWTFFGSSQFTPLDITNATALAAKLRKPARNDGVSQFLGPRLSPPARYAIIDLAENTNLDLPRLLSDDFNKIIQETSVYEPRRFAGVKLSPEAEAMLDHNLHGTNLMWLNRILMMDAYPRELSKSRSCLDVSVWRVREGEPEPVPILYTNLLIMHEFAETPEQFRRDLEFNKRFHGSALVGSADIPVFEIMDYLRLHPDLDGHRRWLLGTQLYGRLAAPWTCIVVVLIAIPFSAGSGRRNVFYGVAGAIVICFFYFVLLRLGLALGTNGLLPGWLAAWLPNATFGIAGLVMMLRVR